jgi:hypothetical protein
VCVCLCVFIILQRSKKIPTSFMPLFSTIFQAHVDDAFEKPPFPLGARGAPFFATSIKFLAASANRQLLSINLSISIYMHIVYWLCTLYNFKTQTLTPTALLPDDPHTLQEAGI